MDAKVKSINDSQKALATETKARLKEYRLEIRQFKKEFGEKATKQEFLKTNQDMQENRTQFDT